jgi:hypothetical protein
MRMLVKINIATVAAAGAEALSTAYMCIQSLFQ